MHNAPFGLAKCERTRNGPQARPSKAQRIPYSIHAKRRSAKRNYIRGTFCVNREKEDEKRRKKLYTTCCNCSGTSCMHVSTAYTFAIAIPLTVYSYFYFPTKIENNNNICTHIERSLLSSSFGIDTHILFRFFFFFDFIPISLHTWRIYAIVTK